MIGRLGRFLDTPEGLALWLALDVIMWGTVLAVMLLTLAIVMLTRK